MSVARANITNVGAANGKAFSGHTAPDARHKGWLDLVGCTVEEMDSGVLTALFGCVGRELPCELLYTV